MIVALYTYRCGRHVCTLTLLRRWCVVCWALRRKVMASRSTAVLSHHERTAPQNASRQRSHSVVSPSGIVDQGEHLDIVKNRLGRDLETRCRHERKSRERCELAREDSYATGGDDWSNSERRGHSLAAPISRAHSTAHATCIP